MISLRSALVVAATAIAFAYSENPMKTKKDLPDSSHIKRQAITSSESGTNNGYYYELWAPGETVSYENGDGGEYSVTWSGDYSVIAGKGWNPGSAIDVEYSGTWDCDGNCYLSLYGWTTDPMVEFHITDNYGDYDPGDAGSLLGTVTSDGSVYNIYQQPTIYYGTPITGASVYSQYWSVRQDKRTGGTITTQNHFTAWEKLGVELSTFDYMILATEGKENSGTATITVGEGTGSITTVGSTGPTTTSSSTS